MASVDGDGNLPCGHPAQCLDDDGECGWCDELWPLQNAVEGLKKCLTEQAIVIHGGKITLIADSFGYMDIHGGEIKMQDKSNVSIT